MSGKFRRAILHVGAPKCGSTAIQTAFDLNRDWLVDQHLLAYPPGIWHAQLGSCFNSNPEAYVLNVLDRQEEAVRHAADARYLQDMRDWIGAVPPCRDLLLSYEGFGELGVASLERLRDFCLGYADEVLVLCLIRGPLSFARSGLSQGAKTGMAIMTDEFVPLFPAQDYLVNLSTVFGRDALRVQAFDCGGPGIVEKICGLLDLPTLPHMPPGRQNVSLSQWGLEFAVAAQECLQADGYDLTPGEFYELVGKQAERIAGPPIRLSARKDEILRLYWQVNGDYLRDEFGMDVDDFTDGGDPSDLMEGEERERSRGHAIPFVELLKDRLPIREKLLQAARTVRMDTAVMANVTADIPQVVQRHSLVQIALSFDLIAPIERFNPGLHIRDASGAMVFGTNSEILAMPVGRLARGRHRLVFQMVASMREGNYMVGFGLAARTGGDSAHDIYWCDANQELRVEPAGEREGHIGYASLPMTVTVRPGPPMAPADRDKGAF